MRDQKRCRSRARCLVDWKRLALALSLACTSLSVSLSPRSVEARPTARTAAGRRAELPPEVERRIKPLARKLDSLGISARPLRDKAKEGVAKSVPAPKIISVVERLALHLEEGHKAARAEWRRLKVNGGRRGERRAKVPSSLVRAYAEARLSGAPSAAAMTVMRSARLPTGWKRVRAGLDLLADLTVAGYGPKPTASMIATVVKRRGAGGTGRLGRLKGALSLLTRRYGLSRKAAVVSLHGAIKAKGGRVGAAIGHLHRVHGGNRGRGPAPRGAGRSH